MKKLTKIGLVVLALVMVFSMAACSSGTTTTESGTEEAKTYVIATDTTFAPFEFEDASGKMIGIDMDLLAAIAADQGFDYEIQVLGFNAALQAVEAKQVDGMIAGMSITEERKAKFDFSDPYFDSGVAMAVTVTNDTVKGYGDLSGQKVAVKTGTEGATFADSIKDQYGFEIVTFEDSANMYEDVLAGNTVACFEDYPVLGYAIAQGMQLKMVTDMEKGSSYGFAVSKGTNPELIEMFNAGLANLKADGSYQKILDTYIKK